METRLQAFPELTEDSIQQMVGLAERLREQKGGALDDSAVAAIAEISGAPEDYVRLAIKLHADTVKKSPAARIRAAFLSLQPNVRRHVSSGILGAAIGIGQVLAILFGYLFNSHLFSFNLGPLFDLAKLVLLTVGIYNISVSRDTRAAAVTGAILSGTSFFIGVALGSVIGFTMTSTNWLLPMLILGAVAGALLHFLVDKYRASLGLKDPVKERQDLLRQLVDLQDKLRSGEQSITFLSVDIAGSTKLKQMSDPLSVEFTFNEYHRFIEMVTHRYGGRVHSTAGDGVTCAFDTPHQAFGAGRTIQTGILEVNMLRNKIGSPLTLRVGIHSGKVMAPDAADIKSVSFAQVIDIAAHLQKLCPIGGVAVSEVAASHLPGGPRAIGTETIQTDSTMGVVWLPRAAQKASGTPPPPPLPESLPN